MLLECLVSSVLIGTLVLAILKPNLRPFRAIRSWFDRLKDKIDKFVFVEEEAEPKSRMNAHKSRSTSRPRQYHDSFVLRVPRPNGTKSRKLTDKPKLSPPVEPPKLLE